MLLEKGTIVAIIRGVDPEDVLDIQEALLDGGINWVEVSLSEEEKGLACIRKLHETYGGRIHLGVGTVTTIDQAKKALDAGARYIITPGWDYGLIKEVIELGADVLPGVFTPGEIMQAISLGIETVKLFPASSLGTDYIRNLKGPFPKINIMAVGGISLDNIQDYAKAGCTSFGIGSDLVPRSATRKDADQIKKNAQDYIKAMSGKE